MKTKPNKSPMPASLKNAAKKQQPKPALNKLSQPQNRWQRTVRYVWDKKR